MYKSAEESEPQIWNAIRFGSIMENVVIDNITRNPNYYDSTITKNTRVAYPLDNIPNAVNPSIGQHPAIIIFLVAVCLRSISSSCQTYSRKSDVPLPIRLHK